MTAGVVVERRHARREAEAAHVHVALVKRLQATSVCAASAAARGAHVHHQRRGSR